MSLRPTLFAITATLVGCGSAPQISITDLEDVTIAWQSCVTDASGALINPACEGPNPTVFALGPLRSGGVGTTNLVVTSSLTQVVLLPRAAVEAIDADLLDELDAAGGAPVVYDGDARPDYWPTFASVPLERGESAEVFVWVEEMPQARAGARPAFLTISEGPRQLQVRIVPE